jgi:hypothetical protein
MSLVAVVNEWKHVNTMLGLVYFYGKQYRYGFNHHNMN